MNDWFVWVGLFTLFMLTLFTTLQLALRVPSRALLAERFDQTGRTHSFERFLSVRVQYLLATAIVRSAAVLVLFLVVIYQGESSFQNDRETNLLISCLLVWGLLLVFGVAIPNAWANYSGVWLITICLPLLATLRILFFPIIVILQWFDPLVRRLAGVPLRDKKSVADEMEEEILKVITEGELHGAVDEEEKEMIESVIELTDTRVEEIMTPRTDVEAISQADDLDTILEIIRKTGHSRIPIYSETIDTIVGVLYAKDLLLHKNDPPFDLQSMMRKALFIPETKLVRDLLREFQGQKVHIAIVLDEYGGTAGLVTIEDILEELVGEIADEYEQDEAVELKRIDEHTVEVDARMRIDELNDELDIHLPEDEDYETIGGFVFSTLGKIPQAGEKCEYQHISIHVIASEPRRITQLRLNIQPIAEREKTSG